MKPRISIQEQGKEVMATLYPMSKYLSKCSLPKSLLELIYFRVSQINGCAYCLDMHSKDLRASGETEQRLYCLDAWRESPFYTDKERAALEWAESLTHLKNGQVSDTIYENARKHFSEKELLDLTLGVMAINSYNRINIAFGAEVGSYRPGMFD